MGPFDEENSAAQIVQAVTLRGGVELADELVQAAVSDGCPLRRAPAARRDLLLRITGPLGDEIDEPAEVEQHAAPSTNVGDERDDTAEQIVEARCEGLGGIEPREVHLQPPVCRLQPRHRPDPAMSAVAAALPERTAPSTQGCPSQSPAKTNGGACRKPRCRAK